MTQLSYKQILNQLSQTEYERLVEGVYGKDFKQEDRIAFLCDLLGFDETSREEILNMPLFDSKEQFLEEFYDIFDIPPIESSEQDTTQSKEETNPPVEGSVSTWQDEIREFPKTNRQKQIENLERELERKTRELFKLRQEEKQWQEERQASGTISKPIEDLMKELNEHPFGTVINFAQYNNEEREELGPKLKEWIASKIEPKVLLTDKIIVTFWLLNGEKKELPLHGCLSRLHGLFEGNYTFSVDEMTSGIDSDGETPIYMSMLTSVEFKLLEKPLKGKFRQDHESGFFPYRLKEEFKEFAPLLERYQIYYRMDQSERSMKEWGLSTFPD